MKFIAPSKDDIPAKCKEKIAKSTDPHYELVLLLTEDKQFTLYQLQIQQKS